MSYRRDHKKLAIDHFQVVSRIGHFLHDALTVQEANSLAEDYQQDGDLIFIGMDASGSEVQIWTIDEVLNGYLDRDVDA